MLLPLRPEANPPYRARVMLIGGGGTPPVDMRTDATRSCEILDLGTANPAWTLTAQMANPRVMPDAVPLPDGTTRSTTPSCAWSCTARRTCSEGPVR